MQEALGVQLAEMQRLQESSQLCWAVGSWPKGQGRDHTLLSHPQLSIQPLPFPGDQQEG